MWLDARGRLWQSEDQLARRFDDGKDDEKNMLIKDVIEYLYSDEKKHFEESENAENHIYIKINRLKTLLD